VQDILAQLLAGRSLSRDDARRAFQVVLSGEANESQVAAMLALLQVKGVTLDELVGAAGVMRSCATPVPLPTAREAEIRRSLVDTCGTGGAPKTFNVSTAAAIVAASATGSCRVYVAKHGWRSRTGRGSAEVLAALGVNIDAPPEVQGRCLAEVGVCFSFAVNHHPAMKFAAGPRKSLGFPTAFNLLGPLCNPAGARRQVMGVYDSSKVELVAAALAELGAERAMVVHGDDAMDEISTCAPTTIAHVEEGRVRVERFDAVALGIVRANHNALTADSVEAAAGIIRGVLEGRAGPARDIVAVNAAAALVVGGGASDLAQGLKLAHSAIDAGASMTTLLALAHHSHRSA